MSTESVKNSRPSWGIPLQTSKDNQQPIFIALIILGILGLAVSTIGFTSLGAHQNWWSAGDLGKLSQMTATIMVFGGAGGCGLAQLILSITGLAKAQRYTPLNTTDADDSKLHASKDLNTPVTIEDPLLRELDKQLAPRTYTLVPLDEKNAEIIYKPEASSPHGSFIRRGNKRLNLETSQDIYDVQRSWRSAGFKFIYTHEIKGFNLKCIV